MISDLKLLKIIFWFVFLSIAWSVIVSQQIKVIANQNEQLPVTSW